MLTLTYIDLYWLILTYIDLYWLIGYDYDYDESGDGSGRTSRSSRSSRGRYAQEGYTQEEQDAEAKAILEEVSKHLLESKEMEMEEFRMLQVGLFLCLCLSWGWRSSISILLTSYFMWNGALGSSDLLQSYSIIPIPNTHNHHTNIYPFLNI